MRSAQPAELTAELLRECRGAASAAASELQSRERELAALSARWPQPRSKLLAPGSGGRERAADAQAAAELRGAQPASADPPSKADGFLLEEESLAQLRESLLVWLQASQRADAGGAAAGADPPSLDESGDAPDMARLKQLARRGVTRVTEILDEIQPARREVDPKRRAKRQRRQEREAAARAGGGADESPGEARSPGS